MKDKGVFAIGIATRSDAPGPWLGCVGAREAALRIIAGGPAPFDVAEGRASLAAPVGVELGPLNSGLCAGAGKC